MYTDDADGFLPYDATFSWWDPLWFKNCRKSYLGLPSELHPEVFTCPTLKKPCHDVAWQAEQGNYAINKELSGQPDYEAYPSRVIIGVEWAPVRISSLESADRIVLLSDSGSTGPDWNAFDIYPHYSITRWPGNNTNRVPGMGIANAGIHQGGANPLFSDGHCWLHRNDYLQDDGMHYVRP